MVSRVEGERKGEERLSAATEGSTRVATGDRVFVHPHDEQAPTAARGVAGTITAIRGLQAQLCVASTGEQLWVDAALLRPDQRRKRQPADWSIDAGHSKETAIA